MKKFDSKKNPRVLIVDDYAVNLELTKYMLEMIQCEVDTTESGVEAIALAEMNPYDIIFMDIQMPGMDGVEAMKKIRKVSKNRSVPIVALTAHAIQGDREKYLDLGMDDYIDKPITADKLEAVLIRNLSTQRESS